MRSDRSTETEDPPIPRQRKDVARNRERLLAAALVELSGDRPPSLDAIARAAGVGIATLYRHFPTREALVEAVYRAELGAVCEEAAVLAKRRRGDRALRAWFAAYADFVATKRGMAEAVREVVQSGAVSSAETRSHLAEAVALILAAGAEDGSLRDDVRPEDVVAALAGVVLSGTDRHQVDRVLDLVAAGVRSESGPAVRVRSDVAARA